jgi:pilus assembly protein Flp/PilA
MIKQIKNFVKDESGATMIEYGLIAALVSVAAIIALTALGTSLSGMFQGVADQVTAVTPATSTTSSTTSTTSTTGG